MSDRIQPSNDAAATALAVAHEILNLWPIKAEDLDPDRQKAIVKRAELTASLARKLLDGVSKSAEK